ncbi:MAG TPA: 2-oxoacid:ferredoxin oxidoreductase subunit beta [Actinomycetota bacterium]|nr:2-oxoacid:ferredoxin oxidoreductase subunit beta [Actinomycetota bacterium]
MTEPGVNGNGGAISTGEMTRKDFVSDQEVRWCPGCGDYAVLAAVQGVMPELTVDKSKVVFVSGIGCSSRFPYYMNTYGLHGIHGRAPAIAAGIVMARPDLQVWVVTGDGDALSIGGNHLIHSLRRNFNLKILLFNNQIYGLTKGQYSPTSEVGKVAPSTPMGSIDHPFNPVSLALGSEATFVARTFDSDRKHLIDVLQQASEHRGSAFLEIYQNCPVFNDGAFELLTQKGGKVNYQIRLVHGEKIVFGENNEKGVVFEDGQAKIVDVADVGIDKIQVHDAHREDPSLAFALSRLAHGPLSPTPVGIFRSVKRPAYEDSMAEQVLNSQQQMGPSDLEALLNSGGTWEVPAR